jgi:uncharacterized protein YifE (UPF0438 family)
MGNREEAFRSSARWFDDRNYLTKFGRHEKSSPKFEKIRSAEKHALM